MTAYNEIFHELLATIGRSEIAGQTPCYWLSKHPVGAPYFLEFIPLITDEGGVLGYEKDMAYAKFIPRDGIQGDIGEAERAYIASLIAHADGLGRQPVLSCKRSLGRLPAIKSAFPGSHILIYRNLFRQWCSYTEQYAHRNPFFFETVKLAIGHSGHDKFCNYLKEAFPLEDRVIDSAHYFCAFALAHIYLFGQVTDAADMILDVEKAACNEEYRKQTECEIRQRTGLAADLSSIKPSIGFSFLDGSQSAEIKERIRIMSDVALSLAPSETGRTFAAKALADLMEEWEKYDFYAGALSAFAGPRGLLRERNTLAAECDALRAERDALTAELTRRNEKRRAKRKLRTRAAACLRPLLSLLRPQQTASASMTGGGGVHIEG